MSERKKIRREVEFHLTETKIVAKAMRIAELSKRVDEAEAKFKALAKDHRASQADLDRQIRQELDTVVARRETRTVDCELERDFEKGCVRYYHSGAVIEERPMDAHERQLELGATDELDAEDDLLGDDDDPDDDGPPDGERIPHAEEAAA